MQILNLVDKYDSTINYEIQKFPDGQQNIVIKNNNSEILQVLIKSRLNNWLDLELIVCVVASLREIDKDMEIYLYIPYIMGARSDRKFEEGGNNYLRDVLCPIINSLNFKTVTCIDPHSYSLEGCIKNFKSIDNSKLVNFAIDNIVGKFQYKPINGVYSNEDLKNIILISPDAGASKKIYKLAEQIGYNGDIITCSKDRDVDGKLTKTVVPYKVTDKTCEKDIIIIDDICDGAKTFINIAKIIKESQENASEWYKKFNHAVGKIYLITTHGIYSKGFGELQQYFDGIYTTNSYQDLMPDTQSFVKQLNVF